MNKHKVPEKIAEFIREEAKRLGYEVVDISQKSARGASLEIVIDKKGGITLDECISFNRKVTSWIEEHKIFDQECTLDVCSPGLDRVLKSDNDFLWAVGKEIEIKTHEPVNEKNVIAGKLLETQGDNITVEEASGKVVCVSKNNVAKARLRVVI